MMFVIEWIICLIFRGKGEMNRVARKALKHSAVQGDSYVFWYSGDTRKSPQIVNNTQMRLGDENTVDIQEQPWIIIEERLAKML